MNIPIGIAIAVWLLPLICRNKYFTPFARVMSIYFAAMITGSILIWM